MDKTDRNIKYEINIKQNHLEKIWVCIFNPIFLYTKESLDKKKKNEKKITSLKYFCTTNGKNEIS